MLMSALVTKKRVRIPLAVNPRFPQPCSSAEGEPDPKVRPKGVTDGKQVNIPVLAGVCLMPRGDAEGKVGRVMDVPVQGCRRGWQANPLAQLETPRSDDEGVLLPQSDRQPRCQEKPRG